MLIDPVAAEEFKHADKLKAFSAKMKRSMTFNAFLKKVRPAMKEDWVLMKDPDLGEIPWYYYCKHLIALNVKPRRIVEIGVRAGLSGWTFMSAHRPESYVGFDSYVETAWTMPIAKKRLSGMADKVEIIRADTQTLEEMPEADFYHVDGIHTRGGVFNDLVLCHEAAPHGAAILVDDVMCGPEVIAGVYDFILAKSCYPVFYKDLRGEALFFKGGVPHPSWAFMLQSTFPHHYKGGRAC